MSNSRTIDTGCDLSRGCFMSWLVCLSAGLFFFYEFFQLNIFDVINKPLRQSFQVNAIELSWLSSTYLWADILFLLPAGILLDRFSTRKVILAALSLCIVGTIGFALTHSFTWAAIFHSFSGVGNAFCFLACVVLVTRWFHPRRQALVIGLLVTMAFLGGMAAHTPFAYLAEYYGWRQALLIDGFVGLAILAWIALVVQDSPSGDIQFTASEQGLGLRRALLNRQTWLGGLYASLLNLPIMVLCALWGASYLEHVHHLSGIAASNTASMIFMGSIVGCPLVGWLSDRQGRRKPLMIWGAGGTLVALIPFFIFSEINQTVLTLLFLALGFFTSTQVITYPIVAENNALEHTGTATGIASILIMGGGGLGQVIFGALMQHSSSTQMISAYSSADFQRAMWMFPISAVVALLVTWGIRETFCKRLA